MCPGKLLFDFTARIPVANQNSKNVHEVIVARLTAVVKTDT
jgi:hypothetical protein